jgi:hypothetical protein
MIRGRLEPYEDCAEAYEFGRELATFTTQTFLMTI